MAEKEEIDNEIKQYIDEFKYKKDSCDDLIKMEKERGWQYSHINKNEKKLLDNKIKKIQDSRQD